MHKRMRQKNTRPKRFLKCICWQHKNISLSFKQLSDSQIHQPSLCFSKPEYFVYKKNNFNLGGLHIWCSCPGHISVQIIISSLPQTPCCLHSKWHFSFLFNQLLRKQPGGKELERATPEMVAHQWQVCSSPCNLSINLFNF